MGDIWCNARDCQMTAAGCPQCAPVSIPQPAHPMDQRNGMENLTMNKQQEIAISDPCFEAGETKKPKFYWRLPQPQHDVTCCLTANIGLE